MKIHVVDATHRRIGTKTKVQTAKGTLIGQHIASETGRWIEANAALSQYSSFRVQRSEYALQRSDIVGTFALDRHDTAIFYSQPDGRLQQTELGAGDGAVDHHNTTRFIFQWRDIAFYVRW
ncbi:MAG TPA: hypothetical protein DE109_03320 [Aeromonas sp.]|nr:hypothetical protein [Aeromonas sp.]